MKENQKRELYLSQKLRNIAYNTKYNLLKFFQQYNKDSLVNINSTIYILGQAFTTTQKNLVQVQQKIYEIFQTTPWLTYRCGFPQLQNQIVGSYVSDTGWGCMVRVGQMLFAQVIKHHKGLKNKTDILTQIMPLFSDFDKNQPFSIHKISGLARQLYGLKPGQWFNPSQICFVLNKLYQQYQLARSLKLKFVICISGNLFFDQLIQTMLQEKIKQQQLCKCSSKYQQQFICTKCYQAKYSIAIIILSRLGLSKPEKKYLNVLQKLMEIPSCQGVVGGKPEKALYFIGKQNQYLIYLDPHYVHEATNGENKKEQTYFCESFRKCKNTSIDSSIGTCFYFNGLKQLNKFHKSINDLKKQCQQNFFIYTADSTPSYLKNNNSIKYIKSVINKEDDFQVL